MARLTRVGFYGLVALRVALRRPGPGGTTNGNANHLRSKDFKCLFSFSNCSMVFIWLAKGFLNSPWLAVETWVAQLQCLFLYSSICESMNCLAFILNIS